MQLMNTLCHRRYEKEVAEQEYRLLHLQQQQQQQHPSVIEPMQQSTMRRHCSQQRQDIAEQLRGQLFTLCLAHATDERSTSRKSYDAVERQTWMDRRAAPDNEKIPLVMLELIEQRANSIAERLTCIYDYRARTMGMDPRW